MNQDNIDPITGESVETPSASPAGMTTPEPANGINPQGVSDASAEEVAWSELKGPTQDRIKSILKERDQWKYEAERRVQSQVPQYQTPSVNPVSPDVQNAVAQLSNVGIATDAKVDEKINQSLGNLIYNFTLKDLETKYDGSDGLPKFDRTEYQDFVNKNPQYQTYDPKDVYEKMYSEELLDAKLKARGNPTPSRSNSLKPAKTVIREEQWSPDWIESRMKQPDGMEWYARNKQKVNDYLQSQGPTVY